MGNAKGKCCCNSPGCIVDFLAQDNCNSTIAPGSVVTVYTTSMVVVTSGVVDEFGHIDLDIVTPGTYRIGTLKDCVEILTGNVTLTCGLSPYIVKVWQQANLGNRTITISGTRCKGNWGGTSVTVGGETVTMSPPSPTVVGTLTSKPCGTVSVTVNGGVLDKYNLTTPTLSFTPSCTAQSRQISLSRKTGFVCCTDWPSSDSIVSRKLLVADDFGSATIEITSEMTVCAGSWCHLVTVPSVAPPAAANGNYNCVGVGLIPYPVIATTGQTYITYTWSYIGGVFTVTQKTPHYCHVWRATEDQPQKCDMPWYTQQSRYATNSCTPLTSNELSWNATSASITNVEYPGSWTANWSQTGSYDVVVNNVNNNCLNTPFPASTSFTVTELTP